MLVANIPSPVISVTQQLRNVDNLTNYNEKEGEEDGKQNNKLRTMLCS